MTNSNNSVLFPKFSVKNAEIITAAGSGAICEAIASLHTLGTLLDQYDNGAAPLPEGHSYGLGCILKMIAHSLSDRAYGEMVPLDSGNVQSLLDGQDRGRHEE